MLCSSRVMEGQIPARDATVVRRLRTAGATIIAKLNMGEFGGVPASRLASPVRHPRDEDRAKGRSSSGSAVAVAEGAVNAALGTDTGGSIRIPAAFCGVVGLKPTYGVVPLTGVVEHLPLLNHVGPLARKVVDAARILEAIAG